MRDGYRLAFGAFDKPDAPKAQALKPLEEAAEVYGAWQQCDDYRDCRIAAFCDELRRDLIDECRPQDRAHAYLGKYRVRRGYNDTAMQVAVTDMIERAYEAGRAEVAGANLVQNLRRQLTSIEATVGDAIDLLDESTGAVECDE